MAFPFAEDHDMIREAARGFLQDWYDGGKGPQAIYQSGKAFDAAAWQGFAAEQGMAGIAIDEAYGGAGLGDLGRVVIMEELGASLCAVPFLQTCGISVDLLNVFSNENLAKIGPLKKVANGQVIYSYCEGLDAIKKAGNLFTGEVRGVLGGECSDVILFSVRVQDAVNLYAIMRETDGLSIVEKTTMDPTRVFSDVKLTNVKLSDIVYVGTTSEATLNEIAIQSFIALAAECVGGAQKCLDMTLEYAGQRVQFDRPISSFQAIKHRCADMFVLIEAARSAVYAAAVAPPEEKTEAAIIAKAYATDAFFKVAGDAIQLHGGIGFTWDYPLHFFFKRARANRSMFGSSSRDYDRLADKIFGDAA